MYIGKSYKIADFLFWTRRNIYWSIIFGIGATVFYQLLEWRFLAIPWTVVALLGTATVFTIGFKNLQTYNRTNEASQIWCAIVNSSRVWGVMARDYLADPKKARDLINRHFAWITALSYQMRETRIWETINKAHNEEYKSYYAIPELKLPLEEALTQYIPQEEIEFILSTRNRAVHLMSLQSKAIKQLYDDKEIEHWKYLEFQKAIKDFFDQQGKSERIKNAPYPRQYATINSFFIRLFCLLLPFGLLGEFDKMNNNMTGILQGNMVWLVIPFSIFISWVYTSLEQVGESTENPFEGSPNDVPITHISRAIEIDLREMLGESDLPPMLIPQNDIVL